MGDMLDKAKESWSLAEEYWREVISLNFSANRFYYSLFQIADEFNRSSAGKKLKRGEKQSSHELIRAVVREAMPTGKMYLLKTFKELGELRVTADYHCENITLNELDEELVREARELFTFFETKLG
jgi:hypothetical protein